MAEAVVRAQSLPMLGSVHTLFAVSYSTRERTSDLVAGRESDHTALDQWATSKGDSPREGPAVSC